MMKKELTRVQKRSPKGKSHVFKLCSSGDFNVIEFRDKAMTLTPAQQANALKEGSAFFIRNTNLSSSGFVPGMLGALQKESKGPWKLFIVNEVAVSLPTTTNVENKTCLAAKVWKNVKYYIWLTLPSIDDALSSCFEDEYIYLEKKDNVVFLNQVAGPVRDLEEPDFSLLYAKDGGFLQRPAGPDILVSLNSCDAFKEYFLRHGLWIVTIPSLTIREDFSSSKSRVKAAKLARKQRKRSKFKYERHQPRNGALDILTRTPPSKEKSIRNRNPYRAFPVRGRKRLPDDNHHGPNSYYVVQSKFCKFDYVLL